jgi:ApbE superfamily uncharacterized protein (UPF0280 family)
MPPLRNTLSEGRWHFQHGPIDLIIGAEGPGAVEAHEAAWSRFQTVLPELVAELQLLRQPLHEGPCPLRGTVARRMWAACEPYHRVFITPMAAVAGAVAQEIVAAYRRDGVRRAWVNNGGDIALHLAPGAAVYVGLFADLARFHPRLMKALPLDGRFEVDAESPVRGIATSGWRGRSFSLGIADSVTVLAASAAQADVAATIIANAVNIDDARIRRQPAASLKDDSDLGQIAVTIEVPPLQPTSVVQALQSGAQRARELHARGLIEAALLLCQGQVRAVGEWNGQRQLGSIFA